MIWNAYPRIGNSKNGHDNTPTRTAVLDGGQRLNYAELAAASGRLAMALRAAGVVPGDLVAFCLPRSVHCLTALLGILRAGAAYVPIDPKAPVHAGSGNSTGLPAGGGDL